MNTADTRELKEKLDTIARIAKPVSIHEDSYGWVDYHAQNHILTATYPTSSKGRVVLTENCSWIISEDAEFKDTTVYEFEDTFSEDSAHMMVDVSDVACACGKYTDVTLRFAGSVNEFLLALFEKDRLQNFIKQERNH